MIEHEIKLPVDALEPIRARLRRLEAEPVSPCDLEVDVLFDTADGRLRAAGEVLRLRRVGTRRRLTFKGRASFDGPVKSRTEIEAEIESGETVTELLRAIGFTPTLRYEKYRESWRLAAVRIDLDRTPMGDFVELEGPDDDLVEAARRIGLDPGRAVSGSYPSLWQAHRRRHPSLGADMVFDQC